MSRSRALFLGLAAVLAVSAIAAVHFGFLPFPIGAAGAGGAILALTIPPSFPGRNSGEQQLHFYRKRFTITDVPALTAGLKIGRLPSRAFIHSVKLHKTTAFNSATTDTIQIGTTAAGVDVLAATTIQGTGYVDLTAAAGLGVVVGLTGEADIFLKYAQTGAVATAGDVTLIIAFLPDNDQ